MKLLIAKFLGFCTGVNRAYNLALKTAKNGEPVYMLGYLVHNQKVIDELKAMDLELGRSTPGAGTRFEESRGEGRSSDYEVRAEFLSSANGKVLVRLRFDAGWSARGGSLGVGMSEAVISAPVELSESKLFLIGAPASKMGGSSSGAVYWLAVSATPAPSAPSVAGRL